VPHKACERVQPIQRPAGQRLSGGSASEANCSRKGVQKRVQEMGRADAAGVGRDRRR